MASTQELLTAINNMQANAQTALPVMPNNGNPGGVYNTPAPVAQQPQVPPVVAPRNDYSWLKASPAMDVVRSMLKPTAPPAQQLQQQVAVPQQNNIVLPRRMM